MLKTKNDRSMPYTIDLNADLGEGCETDVEIMSYITSANIACGGHAGDQQTMRSSLHLAAVNEVIAGAHPSFPDRIHFGRKVMDMPINEIGIEVREQIEGLFAISQEMGVPLKHVKPHGALYLEASQKPELSYAIAQAVASAGIKKYFILAGADPKVHQDAEALGLQVIKEGFADRGYTAEGDLISRDQQGALLPVPMAIAQGIGIARHQRVCAENGVMVDVPAQSLCLHGDGPNAAELAQALREGLEQAGVRVAAP